MKVPWTPVYPVLKPETGRGEFEDAARKLGLVHQRTTRGEAQQEYEEVWSTADGANAVHYVEDSFSGTRYFGVRGPDAARLTHDIARWVSAYSPEELIETATSTTDHNELVTTLFRLAVSHPRYDATVAKIFEHYATEAANPLLREAATNALFLRQWPESLPALERIARDDPERSVREAADRFASHLRSQAAADSRS